MWKIWCQKRTRTSTPLRVPAPEAGASTNSAIWAFSTVNTARIAWRLWIDRVYVNARNQVVVLIEFIELPSAKAVVHRMEKHIPNGLQCFVGEAFLSRLTDLWASIFETYSVFLSNWFAVAIEHAICLLDPSFELIFYIDDRWSSMKSWQTANRPDLMPSNMETDWYGTKR